MSASAKLLNCDHILEGARPGCQEETEREGLGLLAEVGMEVESSGLESLPQLALS